MAVKWTTDLNHPEPSLVATYKSIPLRMYWRDEAYVVINSSTGEEVARAPSKGELYRKIRTSINEEK